MRSSILRRLIILSAILAVPFTAYAQDATATLSGTVRDTTGSVMPGVSVTAVHEATGNTFRAVSDELGIYRLVVRPGVHRISAELPGFSTVVRPAVELLVGQERVVNFEMAVSAVQEAVTVTAETPLLETTRSTVGGNIDPLQMTELPVQGRNWMSLALLAPGNRTTQLGAEPVQPTREDNPDYALNLGGQQVGNTLGALNEPRDRIYGVDFRDVGQGFEAFAQRLRPDGSIVPRAGFVSDPVHRVDMRLQKRLPIGERVSIDGILELYNLFNRGNFGDYVTDEASALFGEPEFNPNLAYAPRTLQLGFRLTF